MSVGTGVEVGDFVFGLGNACYMPDLEEEKNNKLKLLRALESLANFCLLALLSLSAAC